MPFTLRPYRRFPVQSSVTYNGLRKLARWPHSWKQITGRWLGDHHSLAYYLEQNAMDTHGAFQ